MTTKMEDLRKIHSKFTLSSFKLCINSRSTYKVFHINVKVIILVQNFTRFQVDPFIFAYSIILKMKNANKVNQSETFTSEQRFLMFSTLSAFFTHKSILLAKINGSTWNLVKFWTSIITLIFMWKTMYVLLELMQSLKG